MSFFDLPPPPITYAALDAFLQERLPESLNLDYKRDLTERVFETIAAMGNTYGGIVLVGIDEDPQDPTRPLLPPVGVGRDDRERLVNQSFTRFHPPFAPDVVPVPLPGGNEVLVVRVDPSRAERPIVLTRGDDHKIFVRLEARNAPADRYRMAALFAEAPGVSAASIGVGDWNLMNRGPYPLDDRERPALAVRVAIEAQLPRDRFGHAVIDTTSRQDLAEAMGRSALTGWLSSQMEIGGRGESWTESDWMPLRNPHSNLSSNAALRWRSHFQGGLESWLGGQVSLVLPGAHATAGRLALLVDATFDPLPLLGRIDGDVASIPTRVRMGFRERLDLRSFNDLLLALLHTAIDEVPPATFPRILGVPAWETLGPVAYVHTSQALSGQGTGVGRFLDVGRFEQEYIEPNLELGGATFVAPRYVTYAAGQRDEVVKEWLTRLLLDMGLGGFEDEVGSY